MASKSTTAISEILGIVPTSSSSVPSGSGSLSDNLISPGDELTLESLTTSTKSVADYFRDKLLSKSSAKTGATPPIVLRSEREAEAHDAPRSGLGSSRPNSDLLRFSISSVPALRETYISQPTFDIISIECQEQSASEDISLEDTSSSTKNKRKGKNLRKDAIHLDSEPPLGRTSEGTKHTKSDEKTRKLKKEGPSGQ